MKKRLLALVCVLAILAGMFVMPVTAVSQSEDTTYEVGYAKRDINPWISLELADGTVIGIEDKEYAQRVDSNGDPVLDENGEPVNDIIETVIHDPKDLSQTKTVKLVRLRLGGYSTGEERRATCLTDDNGDGYISYGDGMYITCTTVTDGFGKTILYVTVDVTGVSSTVVGEMRTAIVKKLGAGVINEDEIMVTANHSHSGASFSKGSEGSAFEAYYYYMLDQVAEAAAEAYNGRSQATMSKGSIEASDSMKKMGYVDENGDGAKLNFVRHYITQAQFQYKDVVNGKTVQSSWQKYLGGEYYYPLIRTPHSGSSFVQSVATSGVENGRIYKSYIQYIDHVSEVDETLHVLKFEREEGDPVLMINWRAHSTQNGSSSWNNISADYANSLRYRLENNTSFGGDTNYCVAFWQGASGNVNPSSSLNGDSTVVSGVDENIWRQDLDDTAEEVKVALATSKDAFYQEYYSNTTNFESTYDDSFFNCAKYGYLLAKVTMDCLDSEMVSCQTGKIYSRQQILDLEPQQYSLGLYLAAKEWDEAGQPTESGIFPYWYDADLVDAEGNPGQDGKIERYVLNSKFHARKVLARYPDQDPDLDGVRLPLEEQSGVDFEVNVITLGDNVAIVTLPGEPYDRYSLEATLETINEYNDWDKLINEDTYGTPFALGYSNSSTSYMANAVAYDYLADLSVPLEDFEDGYKEFLNVYGVGSYGSNSGAMAKGSGEQVMVELRQMLDTIKEGYQTYKCEACGKVVDWEPRTPEQLQSVWGNGHYYLTEDLVSSGNSYQQSIGDSAGEMQKTVCLDLNGKTWVHNGRIFNIYNKSTLNIMDSKGGGSITAKSGSYNVGGGMMTVNSGATLSLYSGKLAFERDEQYLIDNNRPYRETNRGGVISCSAGTINVYGGTIQGGQLGFAYYDISEANGADGKIKPYSGRSGSGGAILMTGKSALNVYGGQILAGKAAVNTAGLKLWYNTGETDELGNIIYEERLVPDGIGDCVLVEGAATKVKLYGDAKVDDIYLCNVSGDKLTISGNYTGQAAIQYDETVTLGQSQDVGNVLNSSAIKAGTLTCSNEGGYQFAACDGDLMLFADSVVAAIGTTAYDSLETAIADHSDSTGFVKLLKDVGGVEVNKSVYMDLNGHNIGSVTGSGKLLCLDTQTDDYVIEGDATTGYSGYGVVGTFAEGTLAAVSVDDQQTVNSYAMIYEAGKGYSFHSVNLQLTHMSLKAKVEGETEYNPSLYYKSAFAGDALVADNVKTFGIALSVQEEPNATNMGVTNKYSWFDGENFKAGENNNDATSTLLYGVMKESNARLTNQTNAKMPVIGRAYVQLENGAYVFGISASRTLKQQVEDVNANWSSYTAAQQENMINMYKIYEKVMRSWNISNIVTAASEEN